MSCFHPNYIRQRIDDSSGAVVSAFLGKAFSFSPDLSGTFADLVSGDRKEILVPVPCGHCLGCNMDYAHQWADRMLLELQTNPKALFVTLTYRPSDLPLTDSGNPTLLKRHPQLFLKRLRRHFPNRSIRYYLCGEYGSNTHRPHYHAILYGLSLEDFPDCVLRNCNELDQPFYSSEIFANIWSYGFCLLSSVSWQTCNYVARYVTKKQIPFDYGDRLPPYNVSSRKPGLGFDFCRKMLDLGVDHIDLQCGDTVKTVSFPSTVLKKFCEYGIDECIFLKYNKSENCRCSTLAQIEASGLSYDHILLNKERDLRNKLYQLPERL